MYKLLKLKIFKFRGTEKIIKLRFTKIDKIIINKYKLKKTNLSHFKISLQEIIDIINNTKNPSKQIKAEHEKLKEERN